MSNDDLLGGAVERLEFDERRSGEPPSKLAQITRRTALGGGAAGLAAAMLAACGGSSSPAATTSTATTTTPTATAIFGGGQPFRFAIVNHATFSDVFTATQNGAADACRLLGCTYDWTGSDTGNVTQMVSAIETAVSARVDGIATSLTDKIAFNAPVAAALAAGIPVVAYNSDAAGNPRLSYVGSDPYAGGREMGQRIAALLPGGGEIGVFIATPGATGLARRAQGLTDALKGSGIAVNLFASGPGQSQESTTIDKYIAAHPAYNGFFAVDGGSTSVLATALKNNGLAKKGVVGGGYDLTPPTQQLLAAGEIEFAIDEQPYLQGFLPILQLYLYKVSRRLVTPVDVDTGLRFVDRQAAGAYVDTTSRFEGTSTTAGVQTS